MIRELAITITIDYLSMTSCDGYYYLSIITRTREATLNKKWRKYSFDLRGTANV